MDERANSKASGVDLHLEPLSGAGLGVRAGLEAALRDAVREGRLPPGTRLPSSRALARDLGVARNTVADAYGQLVAEGWLTARQGSGTRVADRTEAAGRTVPGGARGLLGTWGAAGGQGGAPAWRAGRERGRSDRRGPTLIAAAGLAESDSDRPRLPYDLRPGSPDLSSFPRNAWLSAARVALNRAPHEAFGYTDPRGRPELREALAEYLARARGVRADPELLVVCTGFVQVVGVVGRALAGAGARRIAVEALGFPDTRAVLRSTGLATHEIPVDEAGARVDALRPLGADAVLLTPSHQYPIGVPLSPRRRTQVVAWARESGGVVIEDDYDGEFRYDRQPVGALQGLDPSSVVYAGTASKSLMPGLRLAWAVLPERLLEDVMLQKRLADHHSPVLDQLTLAELIGSGAYDRHVRRMRAHYRRRRDRLVEALAARAPGVRVSGIAAGLHAIVELPPGAPPEAELVRRAAALGLALSGTAFYGAVGPGGGPVRPDETGEADRADAGSGGMLVIGFGRPPEHAFNGALDQLCELLAAVT